MATRGLTLVELMVVLVVLVLLATAARVGLRQNERSGQGRRFAADVVGAIVRARDVAIDEQRPVRVELRATSVQLHGWDAGGDRWVAFDRISMERRDLSSLVDDGACIEQLDDGVFAPAGAEGISTPTGCIAEPQVLRFLPDGSVAPAPGRSPVGATVWIGHRAPPHPLRHTTIEIFAGGLIRVFEGAS